MALKSMEHFPSLTAMFFTRAREKGEAPFLFSKHDGDWQSISWAQTAQRVASFAAALRNLGLKPGTG